MAKSLLDAPGASGVAAAGRNKDGVSPFPQCTDPGLCAAVLEHTKRQSIVAIPAPRGRLLEGSHYIGIKGRFTIETPAHHPNALTIRTCRPPLPGDTGVCSGKLVLELDSSEGYKGNRLKTHWNRGGNPTHGEFNQVLRFKYRLPTPVHLARGEAPESRWTGEKLIRYKGWN